MRSDLLIYRSSRSSNVRLLGEGSVSNPLAVELPGECSSANLVNLPMLTPVFRLTEVGDGISDLQFHVGVTTRLVNAAYQIQNGRIRNPR